MTPVTLASVAAAGEPAIEETQVVTLQEFVAVDEPGAEPLLGDEHGALIPEGGDVMVYGDGGAGKTTLMFDAAFHLASGADWLGIPVQRPTSVLIIENEGPRPLLRRKLRLKADSWTGPSIGSRITVFEHPWGQLTLADEGWRQQLADTVREQQVDVIIAGPLTRLGMDTAGTLQEVVAFMRLVQDVRARAERLLTVVIVHHENKAGAVSGAWEGAADTLLHVQAAGNGHTVVYVQKARWASTHHHTTLKLAWTDGDGFELEGDRDYLDELRGLLGDGEWRTVKEISAASEEGGIGAGEKVVRDLLATNAELFEMRTGDAAKAIGRTPNAKVYGLRSASSAVSAVGALQGGAEGVSAPAPPLRAQTHERTPSPNGDNSALIAQRSPANHDPDAELERLQAKYGDDPDFA